jgi:O-antigen/teichoic acid export membrane protein
MAVLILPVAVIIALYSYELILFWTQNPETAERTHLLVSILVSGTAINGLMNPPYALQLAFGWTRLSFFKTLIAVILVVPLIIYMTTHYGAVGAAVAWLVLNIGMFLLEIPIMHRRLLPAEKWRWYLEDVSLPLIVAFAAAWAGRYIAGGATNQTMMIVHLGIVSAFTLGAVGIATPVSRTWLFAHVPDFRRA